MKHIKINQLKPGMLVARDVHDLNGSLVISQGTCISEKHLQVLKQWGIMEIAIETEEKQEQVVTDNPEVDPKVLSEAKDEAVQLFRNANQDHPAIKEILRLCTLKKINQKSGA